MYSGATPEFIDGDVFKTKISLNEANRSDGGVNGGVCQRFRSMMERDSKRGAKLL